MTGRRLDPVHRVEDRGMSALDVARAKRPEDDHTTTVEGAAAAEGEWYGPKRGPIFHSFPEDERPDPGDLR